MAATGLIGLLVAACAPPTSPAPVPAASSSASPAASSAPTTPVPTLSSIASPSLPPPAATASLPVRASAREIGEQVLLAPGPAGTLFVSIPRSTGSVLALLDRTGRPQPGWPIVIQDSTACGLLLPAEDGSVRVVCSMKNRDASASPTGAFAYDSMGRLLPGWPVDLADHSPGYLPGRVIGNELTVFIWVPGKARISTITANGTLRKGAQVALGAICCGDTWSIGPDGIAYGTINDRGCQSRPPGSQLIPVAAEGMRGGPFQIEGLASRPAFDPSGRIHLTANDRDQRGG